MRMLILAVLLFIPLTAGAVNCDLDPTQCQTTAGCYFDSNAGCRQCPGSTSENPQGHYCEAGTSQPTPCPAPFSSSFAGNDSVNECFVEMQCTDNDGHSYRAGLENNPDNYFAAIGTNNHWWGAGTPSQNDFWNDFHYEVTGTGADRQFTCYYKNITCNHFTSSDSACTISTGAEYIAHWVSNSEYWDVSDCRCDKSGVEISGKHCTGTQQLLANEGQTITYVGAPIGFNNNIASYHCTSCIADTSTAVYYADTGATDSTCDKNVSQGRVCECIALTEKGFYRSGDCGANQNWGSQSDICLKQACPLPGQTTLTVGPTDPDDCTYTDQTQFCDAKGCFKLSTNELRAWGLIN